MNEALDKLPVFATDQEIAVAVVGKERASMYVKAVIPMLERQGFPTVDPLHDGRPVPLIKRFYEDYMGITAGFRVAAPDGKEDWSAWDGRKARGRKTDDQPRDELKHWQRQQEERDKHRPIHKLNAPQMRALRFMIDHPDLMTSDLIPRAAEKTMEALAKAGCLRPGGKDYRGHREWHVTDEGRAEVQREDTYKNWVFD